MSRSLSLLIVLTLAGGSAAQEPRPPRQELVLDAGGHIGSIHRVRFTPDGRELFSVSGDGTYRTWDVASGEPLSVIHLDDSDGLLANDDVLVTAMDLTPDGRIIAVATTMRGVKHGVTFIEPSSGRILSTIRDIPVLSTSLTFSADGRKLASGGDDGSIRVWDRPSGGCDRVLDGFRKMVTCLEFAPDGSRLAAGSQETSLRTWSLKTGRQDGEFPGFDLGVICVAWSPDGRTLATGDPLSRVRLWSATGRPIRTWGTASGVQALYYSPDSRQLLVLLDGVPRMPVAVAPVAAPVARSPSGVAPSKTVPAPQAVPTAAPASSPAEPGLAQPPASGGFRSVPAQQAPARQHVPALDEVPPAPPAPSARSGEEKGVEPIAVVGFAEFRPGRPPGLADAVIIDVDTGRVVASPIVHGGNVADGTISPDGTLAATAGGEDNEIYLWRTTNGSIVRRLVGQGRHTWYAGWDSKGESLIWWTTPSGTGSAVSADERMEQHSFDLTRFEHRKPSRGLAAGDVVECSAYSAMKAESPTNRSIEEAPAVRGLFPGQRLRVEKVQGDWILANLEPPGPTTAGLAPIPPRLRSAYPMVLPAVPADVPIPPEYARMFMPVTPTAVAPAPPAPAPSMPVPLRITKPSEVTSPVPPTPVTTRETAPRLAPDDDAPPPGAGPSRVAPKDGGKVEVPPAPPARILPAPQMSVSLVDRGWIRARDVIPVDAVSRYGQTTRGSMTLQPLPWGDVAVRRGDRTEALIRLSASKNHGPANCWSFLRNDLVALGGYFGLELYSARTGEKSRAMRGHWGHVSGVAPSPDGRYFATTSHDQTVRIWTADRAEPLLSLFVAGEDWVAWTPEGEYAASPGGERLMGWLVARGRGELMSFVAAAQLHDSLYRPAVLKMLVRTGSLERAREVLGTGPAPLLRDVIPPTVIITTPDRRNLTVTEPNLTIRAVAHGQRGNPVRSLRLLVNGRPYEGDRGRRAIPPEETGDAGGDEVRREWNVALMPGRNVLMVEAASAASKGLSRPIEVTYQTPAAPRRTLHLLLMGISRYPGELRLDYAAKDARDLERTLTEKSASLFDAVDPRTLIDEDATHDRILDELDRLAERAGGDDVTVVFFAGHGQVNSSGKFHLAPVDVKPRALSSTGLAGDHLRSLLAAIKGRVLVLLDACRAGAIEGERTRGLEPLGELARVLSGSGAGVVVMCASTDSESALEGAEVRQGYFTKALIEGLSGRADSNRDGVIKVTELDAYVADRVPELSRNQQHAVTAKPLSVQPFALTRP